MTSHCNKDIEKSDTFTPNEERMTTETNDQIYLMNMDLSELQSSKDDLVISISGKKNNLNPLNSKSLQSLQPLKSIAFVKDEANYIEINLFQSRDNMMKLGDHIDKGEESNPLVNINNTNLTPISTICNYYLKSELSGSKTKSYLMGNLMISKPNAEIEILFNRKEANVSTKQKQHNRIVNIKGSKMPGLALTEREEKGKHLKQKDIRPNGILTQRIIPQSINSKSKSKCKNKSTSVKKTSSQRNGNIKKAMINAVKKIIHSLKEKHEDSNPKRIDEENYNKSIKKRRASCSNESKAARVGLSNKEQHTDRRIISIENKMNSTTQAPFKKKNQSKLKIRSIPLTNTHHQMEKIPSNFSMTLVANNNTTNDNIPTRNMIILEVTEHEGETLAPTPNNHHRPNRITKRTNSQQQKTNSSNRKGNSSKKTSSIKKSIGDSNINTTATNKNISNTSNTSRGNLNHTSINHHQCDLKKHNSIITKRPISLKKDINNTIPQLLIIEQTDSKHASNTEYISQANQIKSKRKQLREGVSLPFSSKKHSKPKTERGPISSELLTSCKGITTSAKGLGSLGTNTKPSEHSDITHETNSNRKNSKEHQCNPQLSSYLHKIHSKKTGIKPIT